MPPGRAIFALARVERIDLDQGLRGFGSQREADLAAASELDIDLREQLGVEQRAVAHPVAAVDAVAGAQRIERMLGARMTAAGEHQRVDHPLEPDLWMAADGEFVVEEAEIELRVVGDERRILEEVDQLERVLVEALLVGEEY